MSAGSFPRVPILCRSVGRGVIVLLGMLVSVQVHAGGFELGDQGAKAAGRAGAFSAKADDLSAIEYNPAGLAKQRGWGFYLSNRFTLADESYKRAALLDWSEAEHGVPTYETFSTVNNETPWQYLGPMLGISSDFGLEDWGFALGVYAPSGLSRQQFPDDGPQRFMLTEREVMILYYNASAAWKFRDVFGVGLALQWVDAQRINYSLVIDGNITGGLVYPTQSPFEVTSEISASDHVGATAILGFWYKPIPAVELALASKFIPVKLSAKGTLDVEATGTATFTEPIRLLRDGADADDVTVSFTLPPNLRFGARYIGLDGEREAFDLELDIVYEAWSMVDAFKVSGNGMVATVYGQEVDINRISLKKNWQDTVSLRLGGDYNVVPQWFTLRAGGFYESPASPKETTYLDFIGSHRLGLATGFTLAFFGVELSTAYSYVFQLPVTVTEDESEISQQVPGSPCTAPYTDTSLCDDHYLGRPAASANAGTYLSDYHMITATISYRL